MGSPQVVADPQLSPCSPKPVAAESLQSPPEIAWRQRPMRPKPERRTLLGAKGIATRNKKLLGAPGMATRSKDATRGSWPYY